MSSKTNHNVPNDTNGGFENLPKPALNMARRAVSLARLGNGRHIIEFLVLDGRWLIIVNQGSQIEDLGEIDNVR